MLKPCVVALALFGSGCVEYNSNNPPIVVNVKSDGDECRVTAIRSPYVQPIEFKPISQSQLRQFGRQTKSRRAILVSDVSAEYKCMGAAIITLQQAGFLVDLALWDSR